MSYIPACDGTERILKVLRKEGIVITPRLHKQIDTIVRSIEDITYKTYATILT